MLLPSMPLFLGGGRACLSVPRVTTRAPFAMQRIRGLLLPASRPRPNSYTHVIYTCL